MEGKRGGGGRLSLAGGVDRRALAERGVGNVQAARVFEAAPAGAEARQRVAAAGLPLHACFGHPGRARRPCLAPNKDSQASERE